MAAADLSRRGLITASTAGGLLLAGCDRLSKAPSVQRFTGSAEGLTYSAQRALLTGQPLAREFDARHISRVFKSNGTRHPTGAAYAAHLANGFADWRLRIGGIQGGPVTTRMLART